MDHLTGTPPPLCLFKNKHVFSSFYENMHVVIITTYKFSVSLNIFYCLIVTAKGSGYKFSRH